MQQNVLRWFYQAYVNRLGVHLIELMSGRLAIGAEHYRRLTRRAGTARGRLIPGARALGRGHCGGSRLGQVASDRVDEAGIRRAIRA